MDEYTITDYCPYCNEPFQIVRPGKTQPNCDCDTFCQGCKTRMRRYSLGEDARYPYFSGEWCPNCGLGLGTVSHKVGKSWKIVNEKS